MQFSKSSASLRFKGPARITLALWAFIVVLVSAANAQKVTTLYSFSGEGGSGNPELMVPAQGRDGRLYGTTYGPSGGSGTIFKITVSGTATSLYSFGSDGVNPAAGLTLASDGNFYGTTSAGGGSNNGVLFKVTPSGAYTVLHEFSGGSDGARPFAPPIEASDGNLYGTTLSPIGSGASTVYRYSRQSGFSSLYTFDQAHGQYVASALIQGSDGNLYGTAEKGGTNSNGTIFKLSTAGVILWSYSFPGGSGGSSPVAGLIQASDGNFYGTTFAGGNALGIGTIYRLDQDGNVVVVYTFQSNTDGSNPEAGLVQGTDGNLYGTTLGGGAHKLGTLFKVSLSGTHTKLYDFGGSGQQPLAAPLQHTNGEFYGTTFLGGTAGVGTVYSLDMGLGPFISFVRATGKVGQTAQILSQGLTGSTIVTFNGVKATTFKVVSDTYMTAVVPMGATTGPVVVTTPSGTLTSNVNFRISQ
jgi:uncharacterized repeat protein (TIGR03803 family)